MLRITCWEEKKGSMYSAGIDGRSDEHLPVTVSYASFTYSKTFSKTTSKVDHFLSITQLISELFELAYSLGAPQVREMRMKFI